jgi:hypothetical protein
VKKLNPLWIAPIQRTKGQNDPRHPKGILIWIESRQGHTDQDNATCRLITDVILQDFALSFPVFYFAVLRENIPVLIIEKKYAMQGRAS